MTTKPFWKSRTLWANLGMLVLFGGLPAAVPTLQGHISPELYVPIMALANAALRIVTNKAVGLKAR